MFNDSQLIDGRYRILQQIAEGDLGPVYMATDMETGGLCAVRPISPSEGADLDELKQEAGRIQALEHPNIVPPGALNVAGQQAFLVRDFIEGNTLEELIRWEAPLTLARSCSLARQIAMALEAAHHAGLVHGDLKPANILLADHDGEVSVRVLGFGTLALKKGRFINLARLAVEVEDGGRRLFGAPEYISPEQAMGTGTESLDGRSDLYSLGVILYRMLAGELPFQGNTPMEVLLAQIFTEPPPLSTRSGLEAPLAVETLLMRTLAKKRADRPASATAIIDQLGPWEERRAPVKQPLKETPKEPPKEPLKKIVPPLPQEAPPAREAADDEPAVVSNSSFSEPPVFSSPIPPPAEAAQPVPPSFESFELPTPPRAVLKSAPAQPDAFIPDLAPAAVDEPEKVFTPAHAPMKELEIHLNAGKPASAAAGSTIQQGPVLFSGYRPRPESKSRKWLNVLATVVVLIVVFVGSGCGWLYFTGRTYWFNPEFVKTKISYYLSSGVADGSPQTETVDQPAPQAPPTPLAVSKATEPPARSQPAPVTVSKPAAPAAQSRPAPVTVSKSTSGSLQSQLPPDGGASAAAASRPAVTSHTGVASVAPAHKKLLTRIPPRSNDESASVQDAITRGEYYFDRGDYDAAIQVYEQGLAEFPSNAQLATEIARAKRAKAAESKYLR